MPRRAPGASLPPDVDGVALRAAADELASLDAVPVPRAVAADGAEGGRGRGYQGDALTVAERCIDRGAVARARRVLRRVEALPAEHLHVARWMMRAPSFPGVHVWPAELARAIGPRELAAHEARAVVALDAARKARREATAKARKGILPAWQGGYAGDAAAKLARAEHVAREALDALERWGASRLAAFVEAWRATGEASG